MSFPIGVTIGFPHLKHDFSMFSPFKTGFFPCFPHLKAGFFPCFPIGQPISATWSADAGLLGLGLHRRSAAAWINTHG